LPWPCSTIRSPHLGRTVCRRRYRTEAADHPNPEGLAKQGVTQLIASHHVDELLPLADDILVLKGGRICFYGAAESLLALRDEKGAGVTLDEIVLTMLNHEGGVTTV
jgi:ABC-type Na+ transport system ATPase subunit NatA